MFSALCKHVVALLSEHVFLFQKKFSFVYMAAIPYRCIKICFSLFSHEFQLKVILLSTQNTFSSDRAKK